MIPDEQPLPPGIPNLAICLGEMQELRSIARTIEAAPVCTKCLAPETIEPTDPDNATSKATVTVGLATQTLEIAFPAEPLCQSCFDTYLREATASAANAVLPFLALRNSYMQQGTVRCESCGSTCGHHQWIDASVVKDGPSKKLCRVCMYTALRNEMLAGVFRFSDLEARGRAFVNVLKTAAETRDTAFRNVWG